MPTTAPPTTAPPTTRPPTTLRPTTTATPIHLVLVALQASITSVLGDFPNASPIRTALLKLRKYVNYVINNIPRENKTRTAITLLQNITTNLSLSNLNKAITQFKRLFPSVATNKLSAVSKRNTVFDKFFK